MSHNAKNSRRIAEAKEWSKRRKAGNKGPKINSSSPKSRSNPGKKTYRTDEFGQPRDDRRKEMGEFLDKIEKRRSDRWGDSIRTMV